MRADAGALTEEIVASLSTEEALRGSGSTGRLLVGAVVGLFGSLRRSARMRIVLDEPIIVLVNNPVQHGARLASVLISSCSGLAATAAFADVRHAECGLQGSARDLPGVGLRAIQQFGSLGRMRTWWGIRRSSHARTFVRAAPRRVRAEVAILAQTLRYLAALDSDFTGVRLVLTDFDRGTTARPWIWAARAAGVRVATAVHGSPAAATYLPMLATDVLAWGEAQAEWYASHAPQAVAHVVGRADLPRRLPISRTVDRVVICHSREELDEGEQRSLMRFVESSRAAGVPAVIRRHPSEHGHLGASWRQLEERCTVVAATGSPLSEFLASNDLVVGVASTALIDALIDGHPTLVVAAPARVLPADLAEIAEASATQHPLLSAAGDALEPDYVDRMGALSRRIAAAVGADAEARLTDAVAGVLHAS